MQRDCIIFTCIILQPRFYHYSHSLDLVRLMYVRCCDEKPNSTGSTGIGTIPLEIAFIPIHYNVIHSIDTIEVHFKKQEANTASIDFFNVQAVQINYSLSQHVIIKILSTQNFPMVLYLSEGLPHTGSYLVQFILLLHVYICHHLCVCSLLLSSAPTNPSQNIQFAL